MTSKEIELSARDIIFELYLVYYGRAPDPAGLTFWAGYLAEYTLEETINSFGDSEEYTDNFGDFTPAELINNLYQQAFNRDAEPEGLKHWLDELASGAETLATIAYSIGVGAQNGDADILALKLAVAEVFTETLGKTYCDGQEYGPHSYASADYALVVRDFLLDVTDPLEIEAYKVAIIDIAYTQFLVGVPRCDDNGQAMVVVDVIAPVFSSGDTATIEENASVSTVVYDAQAVDNASGDDGLVDESISYSLSGVDAADFDINAENGEVILKASADYETQSSYAIEVIATDPYSNVSVQPVTVSVIDVDEIAPVFVSGSYVQKNENLPRWNQVYDAQAVDSSGEADVGITYSLPLLKWDNALFTINQQNGIVYFLQSPDYENPFGVDNNYTLLIEASDEYGNTADKIVNLKILDVDEWIPPIPPPALFLLEDAFDWDSDSGWFTFNFNNPMASVQVDSNSSEQISSMISGGNVSFDFSQVGQNNTTWRDTLSFTFTDVYGQVYQPVYAGSTEINFVVTSKKIWVDKTGDGGTGQEVSQFILLNGVDVYSGSSSNGPDQQPDMIFTHAGSSSIMPTLGSYIEGTGGTTTLYTNTYMKHYDDPATSDVEEMPIRAEVYFDASGLATATFFAVKNPADRTEDIEIGQITWRDVYYLSLSVGDDLVVGGGNYGYIGYGGNDTYMGLEGDDKYFIDNTSATVIKIDGGDGHDALTFPYIGVNHYVVFDLNNVHSDETSQGGTGPASYGYVTDGYVEAFIYKKVGADPDPLNDVIVTYVHFKNIEHLTGSKGNDILHGAEGNDHIHGDDGDDTLYGDDGADTLYGGDHHDVLYGDDGDDTLYGGDGEDMLYGGNNDDILWGGDGQDLLYGDDGADTLHGGKGWDYLIGGEGADTFGFSSNLYLPDMIWDFNIAQSDRIDLTDFFIDGSGLGVNDIQNISNPSDFALQSAGTLVSGMTVIDDSVAGYSSSLSEGDIAAYFANLNITFENKNSISIVLISDGNVSVLFHVNANDGDLVIDANEITPIAALVGVTGADFTAEQFMGFY